MSIKGCIKTMTAIGLVLSAGCAPAEGDDGGEAAGAATRGSVPTSEATCEGGAGWTATEQLSSRDTANWRLAAGASFRRDPGPGARGLTRLAIVKQQVDESAPTASGVDAWRLTPGVYERVVDGRTQRGAFLQAFGSSGVPEATMFELMFSSVEAQTVESMVALDSYLVVGMTRDAAGMIDGMCLKPRSVGDRVVDPSTVTAFAMRRE